MTEALTQDIFQRATADQILLGIRKYCSVYDGSFAAWRMPHSDEVHAYINFSDDIILKKGYQLEELETGFICAPFDKEGSSYLIKAEVKINLKKKTLESSAVHYQKTENLLNYISQYINTKPKVDNIITGYNNVTEDGDSNRFKTLVKLAIDNIRKNSFQKVVPSRTKTIELSKSFSSTDNFVKLCNSYQNAFISLIYSPKAGHWLGATPEVLIKTNNETKIFETVALAGTQRHNADLSLSDVAWRQKEIEEQAFVSRYIINCFKKIRLREFEEIGPKTIKAGNLIHLKTTFTVDMESTNFPLLGSVMLELLHPTSAVCGMPLDSSRHFLNEHEAYDRKLFSGFIGPVDNQNETALFVNLRCMEIREKEATLYAGAGITEDSDPEKEWLETEMKMKTLLDIIR
ncbi:MAG: chorismate-binding protein [Bacteroidota bacterium]